MTTDQSTNKINVSVYPMDDPYKIETDEFDILNEAFGRLVHHKARNVVNSTRTPDYCEDVSQEIFISLFTGASKYKRQKFVVGCMEWFQNKPELIPPKHSVGFWTSVWTWQLRAKLGPQHGFRPQHEEKIAAAIDAVDAPIDFEHSPLSDVFEYVDTHRKSSHSFMPLASKDKERCELFLSHSDKVLSGKAKRPELESVRLEAMGLQNLTGFFSNLPTKPCRYKPFEMDEYFARYIKQIIFNQGDKEKDKIIKNERFNLGSIDVAEFEDFIPDTSVDAMDMLWSNQRDAIRSKLEQFEDPSLIRTFEALGDGESNGSLYHGSVNFKEINRRFGYNIDKIRNQIQTIQKVCLALGGLDMPIMIPKLPIENIHFCHKENRLFSSSSV